MPSKKSPQKKPALALDGAFCILVHRDSSERTFETQSDDEIENVVKEADRLHAHALELEQIGQPPLMGSDGNGGIDYPLHREDLEILRNEAQAELIRRKATRGEKPSVTTGSTKSTDAIPKPATPDSKVETLTDRHIEEQLLGTFEKFKIDHPRGITQKHAGKLLLDISTRQVRNLRDDGVLKPGHHGRIVVDTYLRAAIRDRHKGRNVLR